MPEPRKPLTPKTRHFIPRDVAVQMLQRELAISRAIKANFNEKPAIIAQMLNAQGHNVSETDVRRVWIKLRKISSDMPIDGIRAETAERSKTIKRPTVVRTQNAKTSETEFDYNSRRKELSEKLVELGIVSRSMAWHWKRRVLLLEKEGFWKPLAIRDLNGLLEEIERPDIREKQYLAFERESGKRRRKVMEIFLKLLGGKTVGNRYSSKVRGLKGGTLSDKCCKQMQIGRVLLYDTLDELISMGILRRTKASREILMISTPKQMTEYYKEWRAIGKAAFDAVENPE